MKQGPELLMPAGNTEAFFAAIEGGADAVYLGLKQFNARGRAFNFSLQQLPEIIRIAHDKGVKVYLTLNTVIKNSEFGGLIKLVRSISETGVDALIIQDWGLYFILKGFFKELPYFASTQMGNHNSLGATFSQVKGFKRVILARELTFRELKIIGEKSGIETEVFIHGALCYSFSGMCLFSSYVGGRGANRGLCAQPCRHNYFSGGSSAAFFSLNDNQQLQNLKRFAETGISSFKVEGRMKSAEYVYRVAKAYRLAIDHPDRIDEAGELLNFDFGRQKTEYFFGSSLAKAISVETATGKPIGIIEKVEDSFFYFSTNLEIEPGFRIRVQPPGRDTRFNHTISGFKNENGLVRLKIEKQIPQIGDIVYLTGIKEEKFPSELKETLLPQFSDEKNFIKEILTSVKFQSGKPGKEEIFLRISSTSWFKHIRINELDRLLLSFSKKEWGNFKADAPFIQANKAKIVVELPKFISEKSIVYYRKLLENLNENGIRGCVVSHLSQKLLVPEGWQIYTNENVYAFNDGAIKAILEEGISNVVYPYENDFENLKAGSFRGGIVPLYFYPELFYSRMPVRVGDDGFFINEDNKKFRQVKKDGKTVVIPDRPVSFLQYKKQLVSEGFSRFLIDLSYDNPSKNRFKTLLSKYRNSEQIQPSTSFNFRLGMR